MLKLIARFVTHVQKSRLAAATDMLVELERKWQFEWEHTPSRTAAYLKYRARLEELIFKLRTRLGYTEEGN